MSEQSGNLTYLDHYRRYKLDGSYEMGPETDVSLHESKLPRNVNTPQAQQIERPLDEREKTKLRITQVRTLMSNLQIVRSNESRDDSTGDANLRQEAA